MPMPLPQPKHLGVKSVFQGFDIRHEYRLNNGILLHQMEGLHSVD